jgi:hypothetical protein
MLDNEALVDFLRIYGRTKLDGSQELPHKSFSSSQGSFTQNTSKYFRSGASGIGCPLPPAVLYFPRLLEFKGWQTSEKNKLISRVAQYHNSDQVDWIAVSEKINQKTPMECLMQYRNECDPTINQESWTEEENFLLTEVASSYREHDWCSIADRVGNGRTPLQCFQQYQVRVNKGMCAPGEWLNEEIEALLQAVQIYGLILTSPHLFNPLVGSKNWQHVANCLPGRSAEQCKQR